MKPLPLLSVALLLLILGIPALHAQPAPAGADKILRDLAYGDHALQKLDLYLPTTGTKPFPIIIWVHGGGWQNGTKNGRPPAFQLLQHGYAVASLDYRLSGDAIFPAQIEDCRAAVRWLRTHAAEYNLDPTRFGAWGSSAGGHLVALLGTSGNAAVFDPEGTTGPVPLQAVCDFYGPIDLLQMGRRSDNPGSPESALLGGPVQERQAESARANPLTYLDAEDPPVLIIHGTQDRVVPQKQSEIFRDALEKAGVPVQLVILPDGTHGGPAFNQPAVLNQVVTFFDQHLKPTP